MLFRIVKLLVHWFFHGSIIFVDIMLTFQVLSVAVYNHYKRISHASLQKTLVSKSCLVVSFCNYF